MKKMVLKLPLEDEKAKRKAFTMIAGVEGVDSVAVDMKDKKITVVGNADPVTLTAKLRKFKSTELLSVGPAKEDKKEEKKEDKKGEKQEQTNPQPSTVVYVPYYSPLSDENPNGCVIL